MQRGHKITHLPSLEMPARFDPSGIPCVDSGHAHTRATSSHRRHPRPLPGLAPTSVIATVEEVAERGEANWLIWGSVGNRPVLFSVAAAGGRRDDGLGGRGGDGDGDHRAMAADARTARLTERGPTEPAPGR